MAQRAPNRSETAEFVCPECGRAFTRAAALGAHRSRVHGVAGRTRPAATTRTRRAAAPAPPNSESRQPRGSRADRVDRDALLKTLFPNGMPARTATLTAVAAWLDEAQRLARTS
jgi:hypothetical protein